MIARKVMFTHSSRRAKKESYEERECTEVYRHPKGYFIVLEFTGISGNFRESFWPEEIETVAK